MPRLLKYVRQQIIVLLTEKGLSNIEIKKELANELIEVSTSAIYRLIRKYKETNSHADQKKTGLQRLLYKSNGKSISKSTMLRTKRDGYSLHLGTVR